MSLFDRLSLGGEAAGNDHLQQLLSLFRSPEGAALLGGGQQGRATPPLPLMMPGPQVPVYAPPPLTALRGLFGGL